jgi:phosphoribosylanthranilate isomerase
MPTRVKICGLTCRQDALHAAESGADYLGIVLVAQSPRAVTPSGAREILDGIAVPFVVVVGDMDLPRVVEAAATVGASVIQLHGDEGPEMVAELRSRGPWKIWKALRVRSAEALQEGLGRFGPWVDGLLLDSWQPGLKGGTGRVFPWDVAETVRNEVPSGLDLVVAGGLTPENVELAVARLRPQVVDVSSGVEERPGVKDRRRVEAFIRRVRGAEEVTR